MNQEKIRKDRSFTAFTLAEVLITLAIIGVVAALTIPTVIINHRKTTYATQTAKNYTNVVQAFKALMAKDGVFRLSDTRLWTLIDEAGGSDVCGVDAIINGNCTASFAQNLPDFPELRTEFEKVFKVIQIYDGDDLKIPVEGNKISNKTISGTNCTGTLYCETTRAIVLADGTYIDIYTFPPGTTAKPEIKNKTKLWDPIGVIKMDVNGEQSPNQLGRDIFFFMIGNNGFLYAYGGPDFAIYKNPEASDYNSSAYYWKGASVGYDCQDTGSNRQGRGCAGRLVENGWKMKY